MNTRRSHNKKPCSGKCCATDWHPLVAIPKDGPSFRVLDVLPDLTDIRDRAYVPTLVEVPPHIDLDDYRAHGIPVLSQGMEGACTGFGLATVAHYLLRTRRSAPDETIVSAQMFYQMAKRYDSMAGEDYEGSTARGAIKAWYRHGVCPDSLWPSPGPETDNTLTLERAQAAKKYPLGAYFRVDNTDIVAMHSALAEVGILYATSAVHAGWRKVPADGQIQQSDQIVGGHAFAIVAYDADGFWLQNSWGAEWGYNGFAHVTYDDWLANGSDVWVVRLGAEIHSSAAIVYDNTKAPAPATFSSYVFCDMRAHVVSVCGDGQLCRSGLFANDEKIVAEIFNDHLARTTEAWPVKRILFYAHGGLVDEATAVARLNKWRQTLLEHQIYPIFFIWNSDLISTTISMLQHSISSTNFRHAARLRSEILDLADDMIEPFARVCGKSEWQQMKINALNATAIARGGARLCAKLAADFAETTASTEFHLVGHSAGAIFLSLFSQLLSHEGVINSGPLETRIGFAVPVETLTLWAPACTTDLFKSTFLPLIQTEKIKQFTLFTLDDFSERADDCLQLYHKSLLYLVSNALEDKPRVPWNGIDGTSLLGMQKFVQADSDISSLLSSPDRQWILCPNSNKCGSANASQTRRHGDFDKDPSTLFATIARILGLDFVH